MSTSALSRRSEQTPFAFEVEGRRTLPRRLARSLCFLLGLFVLSASDASEHRMSTSPPDAAQVSTASMKPEELRMWMTVGERRFAITLADNATARAFAGMLPLALDMTELNGNEKYARLAKPLATDASEPGTIRNGDLMLYGKDTLVVFYLTFASSYSYTRLGRVDDPSGLASALGSQSVRVVFSRT
jgi:hypothetical protein